MSAVAVPQRVPWIALVGAGGLGGPIGHALAAAGVRLRIFDGDVVEASNLHRQLQFRLRDLGQSKAKALAERLPGSEGLPRRWTADDADGSCGDCDGIIDGSDDPQTKFAVADWATRTGRPSVIAGALGLGGNVFVGAPGHACFRCLFEEPPDEAPSCADAGVLGPVVASVAGLAALAMLELLAGRTQRAGAIWILDEALGGERRGGWPRRVAVTRRPGCPSCAAASALPAVPAARDDARGAPTEEAAWPRC